MSEPTLHVLDDPGAAVAEILAQAARRGETIGLTGGHSVGLAYEQAAALEPDWSNASLWWGDERAVPPDDERSNFLLAKRSLLDRIERQPEVNRIRGELEPEVAALEYDEALEGVTLDLKLLGLGPDGHVASLFPDQPTLDETERRAIGAEAKLEPFVDRITLTLPMLRSAREVLFLVAGKSKAEAARRAFAGEPLQSTPGSLVRAEHGRTTAVLDVAAAAKL
jgi:6-phosphogluconolactonase